MEKVSDRKLNNIIEQIKDLKKPSLEIEFDSTIRKIGNSLFIPILKIYSEKINLEDGDEVEVYLIKKDRIIKSYVCKLCSHRFDSDDEDLYCPACSNDDREDIEEISKDKELKGGIE